MAFKQQAHGMSYGHCDSSFMEFEDQDLYSKQEAARLEARELAQRRQYEIAEDLSSVTCEAYRKDILDHMEVMESETLPDVSSIDIQTEIQWFMRPYLLDFLLEAHSAYQLLPETLHLAVNILDRYCSRRVVYKKHYQLVGCAALLIASKYGDKKENVPTVRELKAMCCSLYQEEMFTQMEWHVLNTLDWRIGHPTIDSFLQLALLDTQDTPEVEHMAWYISEMALYHRDFVSTKPSAIARASLALARYILSRSSTYVGWANQFDSTLAYDLSEKLKSPNAISRTLSKKYASPHFSGASKILDKFLEQQAEMAKRIQMGPLTPPIDTDMFDSHQLTTDAQYLPITPQKNQCPPSTMNGYMTPPITPESNLTPVTNYSKQQSFPQLPSTPTPPPSANQPSFQYYHFGQSSLLPTDHRYYVQQ